MFILYLSFSIKLDSFSKKGMSTTYITLKVLLIFFFKFCKLKKVFFFVTSKTDVSVTENQVHLS